MTRLLVTGSAGQLGREIVEHAEATGHRVTRLSRHEAEACDLTDDEAVRRMVERTEPEAIVHAGAWTAVDACESDPGRAFAVNEQGTVNVVSAARAVGAHVVYVSTDYVFDGTKTSPYVEEDEPRPTSVYGRSKLAGEAALGPTDTVVRTSWVCGLHGANMVRTILRLAADHDRLRFVDDQIGHPTFAADLAPKLVDLGERRAGGTWHVTNQGAVSWYEFARAVLVAAGLDANRVEPVSTADLDPPRPAPRPANSVLDNVALRAAGLPLLGDFHRPMRTLVHQLGASASSSPRRGGTAPP